MTKIDIISGFLGAGKTTLIKKLLKESFAGEQVVLIENEFGEIGIDGGFLKDAGIEIREMNSGCICCSLVGDFGTSLKEVIETYHPDRIIIEPSGVGKLSDVIKAVNDLNMEEIKLNSASTVVDALKCKVYMKNFGEFFDNQVEHAGTIILSRTQLQTEDKMAEVMQLLRGKNAEAHIITTNWEDITGAQILGAMENTANLENELMNECKHHHHHHEEGECCCGHHHEEEHHHHHHEEGECCCGHHHEEEHHHHHHEEGECCCSHHHEEEHHHHHHEEGECCCGHHHVEEHHHHHEEGECCCGHHHGEEHHHHHHADEVFTSWGRETAVKYDKEQLKAILEKLANSDEFGTILRAKGMLPDAEGNWMYFDLVPGEYEVREGSADYTGRICVIGAQLKEDKIQELFGL